MNTQRRRFVRYMWMFRQKSAGYLLQTANVCSIIPPRAALKTGMGETRLQDTRKHPRISIRLNRPYAHSSGDRSTPVMEEQPCVPVRRPQLAQAVDSTA